MWATIKMSAPCGDLTLTQIPADKSVVSSCLYGELRTYLWGMIRSMPLVEEHGISGRLIKRAVRARAPVARVRFR